MVFDKGELETGFVPAPAPHFTLGCGRRCRDPVEQRQTAEAGVTAAAWV